MQRDNPAVPDGTEPPAPRFTIAELQAVERMRWRIGALWSRVEDACTYRNEESEVRGLVADLRADFREAFGIRAAAAPPLVPDEPIAVLARLLQEAEATPVLFGVPITDEFRAGVRRLLAPNVAPLVPDEELAFALWSLDVGQSLGRAPVRSAWPGMAAKPEKYRGYAREARRLLGAPNASGPPTGPPTEERP